MIIQIPLAPFKKGGEAMDRRAHYIIFKKAEVYLARSTGIEPFQVAQLDELFHFLGGQQAHPA